MPQHLTDHWSTLVQVMAWCRQATSYYLSQCCPRSLSPYDVTRPQWVKWQSLFEVKSICLSKWPSANHLQLFLLCFVVSRCPFQLWFWQLKPKYCKTSFSFQHYCMNLCSDTNILKFHGGKVALSPAKCDHQKFKIHQFKKNKCSEDLKSWF